MPTERASSRETVSPGGTVALAVKNIFSAHEFQYTLQDTHAVTHHSPYVAHGARIKHEQNRATMVTGARTASMHSYRCPLAGHPHEPVVIVDCGSTTEKARAPVPPEAG